MAFDNCGAKQNRRSLDEVSNLRMFCIRLRSELKAYGILKKSAPVPIGKPGNLDTKSNFRPADSKSVLLFIRDRYKPRAYRIRYDEEIHVPIFAVFEPNVLKQIRRDLR